MTSGITSSFDNKKLLKALEQFPKNVQKNIMVGATRAGANVIRDEVKQNTPVDTGSTKKSIGTVKRKSRNRNEIKFSVTPRLGGKNSGWKMRFIEFGTTKQAPNPIMRRAFESQADESLTATKKYIAERIPKEVAKAKR